MCPEIFGSEKEAPTEVLDVSKKIIFRPHEDSGLLHFLAEIDRNHGVPAAAAAAAVSIWFFDRDCRCCCVFHTYLFSHLHLHAPYLPPPNSGCSPLPPPFRSLGRPAGNDLCFARRAQVAAAETCRNSSDGAPEHVRLYAALEMDISVVFLAARHAALWTSTCKGVRGTYIWEAMKIVYCILLLLWK